MLAFFHLPPRFFRLLPSAFPMTAALAALLTFVAASVLTALLLRPADPRGPAPAHGRHRADRRASSPGTVAFVHTRRLPANRPVGPLRPVSPWAWLVFCRVRGVCPARIRFPRLLSTAKKSPSARPTTSATSACTCNSRATSPTARAGGPNIPNSAASRCVITRAWTCSRAFLLLLGGANDLHALAWVGLVGIGGDGGGALSLGRQLHRGRVSLQRRTGGIPIFPPAHARRLPDRPRAGKACRWRSSSRSGRFSTRCPPGCS